MAAIDTSGNFQANGFARRPASRDNVRQTTLKDAISCAGRGLHSGAKVSMALLPAEADEGIVFRRTDFAGRGAEIAARWDNVVDTRMCTTVGNADGVVVRTIEHLVAALAGLQVDNAIVEVNGPELPVMDGSAEPFAFLIECAGIRQLDAPRRLIEILKPVSIGNEEKSAVLTPGAGSTFSFEIEFASEAIGRQVRTFDLSNGAFRRDLASARTFGFRDEVEAMHAAGLARGGSLANAVVIDGGEILNSDGLRFQDEFVRHKLLDSLGDIRLAGHQVIGHFHGYRSGHSLNNQLLRRLFADDGAWRLVDASGQSRRGGKRRSAQARNQSNRLNCWCARVRDRRASPDAIFTRPVSPIARRKTHGAAATLYAMKLPL